MDRNGIKLSVIIPVYNAEKYIQQCLDSILMQRMENIEIICVDDGSTDDSVSLIEAYTLNNYNLHILRQENLHAGIARNAGMDIAHGEYIHFLDADDYLYPEVYARMYHLASETNADYLKIKAESFDSNSGTVLERQPCNYIAGFMKTEDYGKAVNVYSFPFGLIDNQCVTPWSGIYKRRFLEENFIRFNDLKCANDRSFYVQVILHAKRVVYMDLTAVAHRVGNKESLTGIRGDNYTCHFRSYSEIEALTLNTDPDLRRKILSAELRDLFVWYQRLSELQKEESKYELYRFLSGLDWAKLERLDEFYMWMREINTFLECYGKAEIAEVDCLIDECRKADNIYIYGAGVMGKKILRYLNNNNIVPVCIIVSDSENEGVIEGVEVKKIRNANLDSITNEAIVFLAAKSIYHIQMIRNLRGFSLKKIITLSDKQFNDLL